MSTLEEEFKVNTETTINRGNDMNATIRSIIANKL